LRQQQFQSVILGRAGVLVPAKGKKILLIPAVFTKCLKCELGIFYYEFTKKEASKNTKALRSRKAPFSIFFTMTAQENSCASNRFNQSFLD